MVRGSYIKSDMKIPRYRRMRVKVITKLMKADFRDYSLRVLESISVTEQSKEGSTETLLKEKELNTS